MQRHCAGRQAGGVYLFPSAAVRRAVHHPGVAVLQRDAGGYYAEKDRAERLRTKSKELHKAVHNMYDRALRKQAARQEELAASGKSEKLRLYGELLSANLYLAQKA